jgi:hypothetical protein
LTAWGWTPLAHFGLISLILGAGAGLGFPYLLDAGEQEAPAFASDKLKPGFGWPTLGIFALGVLALCVMIGEGALADWSAVYLHDCIGTTQGLAAAGYASFSIAMAASRFGGDHLTKRFGPVNLCRLGGALAASGLLLALISRHAAVALAGFACVGAGFATLVPMVFSAAGNTRDMPPGNALAFVTALGYLGFVIGAPCISFTAQFVGLRLALGIIVATSLTAVLLAPALARR